MEAQEIISSENIKDLIVRYFKTIKPTNDKTNVYTAEIKGLNYCELSYIIYDVLKLCILALDHEALEISKKVKDSPIDIALILKVVIQLLPLEEIEFLDEINKMVIANPDSVNLQSVPTTVKEG